MRIPGTGRITLALRRLHNRLSPGVLILLYHRVIELAKDPQWLAVPPNVFDQQLDMLKRQWPILSLPELLNAMDTNSLPKRAIVITFDDGYFDNHAHALPLLEKHDTHATIFVTTGFVGTDHRFFWDALARTIPATPRWNVLQPPPSESHNHYKQLCTQLVPMDHAERDRLVGLALASETNGDSCSRLINASELSALAVSPLITLGAHTVTHAHLASFSLERQHDEILHSKQQLEEMINRPVSHFAYPFGNHADYTSDTVALVRESGFTAACSNFGGSVRRAADRFQLNRVLVRDWPADELHRHITEWFND